MKTLFLSAFFTLWVTAGLANPIPHDLSDQKDQFGSWFPGEYTNLRSAVFKAARLDEGEPPPTQIRLFIARVDLPAFGDTVFYAEWQDANDASKILRQRFYVLKEEPDRDELRLELHIFDPSKPERNAEALGAYDDPSKVSDFTPEDMFPLPGCDIFFHVEGRQFRGAMLRRACVIPGQDVPTYSWSNMILAADAFWYVDGWFNLTNDQPVNLMTGGNWVEFDKLR